MSNIIDTISHIEKSIEDIRAQKKINFPASDTFDSDGFPQELNHLADYLSAIKCNLPENMASSIEDTIVNLHNIDRSIKEQENNIALHNKELDKKISSLYKNLENELSNCPEKKLTSSLFVNIIALSTLYDTDIRNILDSAYKNLGITHVSKHPNSDWIYYDDSKFNDLKLLLTHEFSNVCSKLDKPIIDIGIYIAYSHVSGYTSDLVKIIKSKI